MHGKRIGFTLVELLVVIAIIGVLVALLLPAVELLNVEEFMNLAEARWFVTCTSVPPK